MIYIIKKGGAMFNKSEFEKIAEKYRKPLFKYCYYRLRSDKVLAEETVNDVFVALYKKWDELNLNGNIRAWLYRVADNCIKHNLESYNKFYSHVISIDEAIENHGLSDIGIMDEYFDETDDETIEKYIYRIKDFLPTEYQEIYEYRYIQKKTLTEISEHIGIPYSTLRLRLCKLEPMILNEIKKLFE